MLSGVSLGSMMSALGPLAAVDINTPKLCACTLLLNSLSFFTPWQLECPIGNIAKESGGTWKLPKDLSVQVSQNHFCHALSIRVAIGRLGPVAECLPSMHKTPGLSLLPWKTNKQTGKRMRTCTLLLAVISWVW